MPLDRIKLNDLEIDCIIGVNPEERTQSQKVFVSLELHVDTSGAARADNLQSTVDYEFVAAQAQFLLHLGQFFLLETACHALCRTLLLAPAVGEHRPPIEHVIVHIRKPEGLRGRAVPCVQVERSASEVEYEVQARPSGNAQVVLETPNLGVYYTIIKPGETMPLHLHPNIDEAEMLLTDGLAIQGEAGKRGSIRVWPKGTAHTYQNSSSRCQSLLSLCRPRLRDSDLVLVNGRAAPVVIYSPSELGTRRLNSAWPVLA